MVATAMAVMDMGMAVTAMDTAVTVTAMDTAMDTVMAMDTVTAVTDTTMGTMDTGITVIGTRAVAAGGTVTGMVMALGPAGFGLQLATFGPATEQCSRNAECILKPPLTDSATGAGFSIPQLTNAVADVPKL
jgi:hypothetical protein